MARSNEVDYSSAYNLDAEGEILRGCLSGDDEILSSVVSELQPHDFFLGRNRELYGWIQSAAEDHERLDPTIISVLAGEEVGHYAKKVREGAILDYPTLRNRCGIVRQFSLQRSVMRSAKEMNNALSGPEWRDAMWSFYDSVVEVTAQDSSRDISSLGSYADEVMDDVENAKDNAGITGLRSGIWPLDMGLGGFQKSRMTIVAGRPGMGKTLTTRQIAANIARQGYRILIIDTEMPGQDTMKRLAFAHAGVPWGNLEKGNLSQNDLKSIRDAMDELSDLPLFIDDSPRQTVASIRRNVIRHKPDLLIVDYLQQVTPSSNTRDSREREVAGIADGINQLKKVGNMPVIACAQLSRSVEARQNKRPMLADLRDSGVIEQNADAVVFLYRPSVYDKRASEEEMEFLCRKNRHGSTWEETMYLRSGAMWVEDEEIPREWTNSVGDRSDSRQSGQGSEIHHENQQTIDDVNPGWQQGLHTSSDGYQGLDDFDDFDEFGEFDAPEPPNGTDDESNVPEVPEVSEEGE